MKVLKKMEEKAKQVWDTAEATLQSVDNAHIFSVAQQPCREFPTFSEKEIISGPLLGRGGFSNVFEVVDIKLLDDDVKEDDKKKQPEESLSKDSTPTSKGRPSLSFDTAATTKTKSTLPDNGRKDDNDEEHYHIDTARELMTKRCMRFGSARYAIKRLRPDLNKLEYARGALDLAIEIKYMSVLLHPNIVKMRACSDTPRLSLDTFIIMDRLYGTLDGRMKTWIQTAAMNKGCCGMVVKDSKLQNELLKERLLVAYDLTVAISHMHSLRLLYRDIKPENIGFDIRGDVKVFDFGLMKSLDDRLKVKGGGYGYNLSVCTGSIPYMAPEIALKQPYDKEADVFSFSMLLWEIMSMEILYPDYSVKDYFMRVCQQNGRPHIPSNNSWPAVIKNVVTEGWSRDPQKRPDMKRVGTLIRALLQDISAGDDSIINRSTHMLDRSRKSLHNTLVQGGDGSNHPMMQNSNGSTRRSGRRSERPSMAADAVTATPPADNGPSTVSILFTTSRRESLHQNFDEEELNHVHTIAS